MRAQHRLGNVFRSEAAGEEDRAAPSLRFESKVPVESLTGAAQFARRIGVQQPGIGVVVQHGLQRGGVPHAKCFHAHQAELQAILGRFIAMELEQVQAAFTDRANHQVLGRIDEHADSQDESRQLAGQAGRSFDRYVTRALVVEHKAQRVGTRFGGGHAVAQIGNAADFDLNCHFAGPASHLIGPGTTAH